MSRSSFYARGKNMFIKRKMREPKYYTDHVCHNSKTIYPDEELFFQIAIIDPGTVSCGLRIVRYNLKSKTMNVIAFHVLNFGNNHADVMNNMIETFEDVTEDLEDCHHIVIEHQLLKKEDVYQCFSAILYVLTNFICNKKMMPILIEVDCQLKTSFLGGPRTKRENNSQEMIDWITKKTGKVPKKGTIEIKEWTKMKSRKFSAERGDFVTYHILENSLYKGNEDLSDTVCYEYAWIIYLLSREDIYLPFDRENLL